MNSHDRYIRQEKRSQEKFKDSSSKFKDSSQNFLEALDQRIDAHEKEWNKRADKKKESQQKFMQTRDKFNHQQRLQMEDMEREVPLMIDDNAKRNNPFKLLKYNDPIMNGQHKQFKEMFYYYYSTIMPNINNNLYDAPSRQ